MLGGSIAGLEYDENGDIKGFSPEKFLAGFASGALGSKSLQFLAKKAQTNPKAKALLERIKTKHAKNQSNLATMSNQNPKIDKITPQKPQRDKNMQNKTLRTRLDEAIAKNEIIDLPTQSFNNPKQFSALFDNVNGANGIIKTPYKEIKVRIPYAYRHFYQNTNNKNRDGIKSAFFETFRNPLFITKEKRGDKESIYFYKPFYDKNKKIINLFGIGVDNKNNVDFKTFYLDEQETRIKQILKVSDDKVLYVKE